MTERKFLDQLSNEQLLKRDTLSLYMQLVTCEIIKHDNNLNKNPVTCIALSCYITVTDEVQKKHKYIIQ